MPVPRKLWPISDWCAKCGEPVPPLTAALTEHANITCDYQCGCGRDWQTTHKLTRGRILAAETLMGHAL